MAAQKNYQVIGFSVPKDTARQMDMIAKTEQRTKSELFREMFRVWKVYRKREDQLWDEKTDEIIAEVQAERMAGKQLSAEQAQEEFEVLSKTLNQHIDKMGYSKEQLVKMGYVPE